MRTIADFRKEREELNSKILENGNLHTKRFFNLDTQIYQDGALDSATKELLGLVASIVLRCDDCILYHLIRCKEVGITTDKLTEAGNVALIAGGSITIPHLRRMYKHWEELTSGNRELPENSENH